MNPKDYLILTKGRAICLVLDAARNLLAQMDSPNEVFDAVKSECTSAILNIIVQVATISCGEDAWPEVHSFLIGIGITISSDLNLEMMYMESISEKLPSEGIHN